MLSSENRRQIPVSEPQSVKHGQWENRQATGQNRELGGRVLSQRTLLGPKELGSALYR